MQSFLCTTLPRKKTFDSVNFWLDYFKKNNTYNKCEYVLIGNKKDLEEERVITVDRANEYAKQNNMFFFETSAKTRHNLEVAFVETAENVLKNYRKSAVQISLNNSKLSKSIQKTQKRNCLSKFFSFFRCFSTIEEAPSIKY